MELPQVLNFGVEGLLLSRSDKFFMQWLRRAQ